MADGVTLRLELRDGYEQVLRDRTAELWLRSLAEVAESRRLLISAASELTSEVREVLTTLSSAHGVELVNAPEDGDVVVLADAADLPVPHAVAGLVATVAEGEVADARTVPVGVPASGTPAGACVALTERTWTELGRPTGSAFRTAVHAARIPVRVAAASVFHDVRLDADGTVVDPPAPSPDGAGNAEGDPSSPFLSIVTRTQGFRLSPLAETLTCLAAQTVRDFEVLVMCHRVAPEARAGVAALVDAQPAWLRERIRLLDVERPGRSAPLNEGFTAAAGRYIAGLDDDNVVLSHWVETFRDLAERSPGRVLRVGIVCQDMLPVQHLDGSPLHLVAKGAPYVEWPTEFSIVDHLHGNFTEFMTVAFPRSVVHELGHRFDEELSTTEDWEFIVRAVVAVGLANEPERTCVYRTWSVGTSRAEHSHEEWDRARERVLRSFDGLTITLPPGSAHRVAEMQAEIARLTNEVARLRRDQSAEQVGRLQHAHDQAVRERDAYLEEVGFLWVRVRELEEENRALGAPADQPRPGRRGR
ncbi:glycosyltransferase [Nocardioides sp. CGMCC 1.13656]|uniref:glycosyltransferase n=1 Tax=Nocardioides TaxID=1839 RepID=UPI0012F8977E|nr:glycosyltransferase [Nocardioides sp. CGMCC 1.13656]MBA2954877.1 glycosyltransferase [Nocardioides sp. CGMCC 1.13656]